MAESSPRDAISPATLQGLRVRCAELKAVVVALERANAVREDMLNSRASWIALTQAELEATRGDLEAAQAKLERIRAELGVAFTEDGAPDAPFCSFIKWKVRRLAAQMLRRAFSNRPLDKT